MLARADVMAVDTAPDQLRVSARLGRLPAVAVHEVVVGAQRLELRILAASHQVVVGEPEPNPEHVETVACGLAASSAAPLADGRLYGHDGWCVAASVVRYDAGGFARQAQRWLARGRDDRRCVVVAFPNHPQALTALAVDVREVLGADHGLLGWTGVHLYPSPSAGGGGVVVRTTTRRTPTAAPTPMSGAGATGGRCSWEVPV